MFNNGWRKPSDVMANYLDRIGAGWILANPEVFDFDYIPQEMVGREDVQMELASKFATLHAPEGAGRAVITGPVGKWENSTCAKHFVEIYNAIYPTKERFEAFMSIAEMLQQACVLFNEFCTNSHPAIQIEAFPWVNFDEFTANSKKRNIPFDCCFG